MTSLVCLFIKLIVPLRLDEGVLQIGDDAIHGEETYVLWDDEEKYENTQVNSAYDADEYPSVVSKTLSELQMV